MIIIQCDTWSALWLVWLGMMLILTPSVLLMALFLWRN
jgi:hypothetical protein